MATYNFDLLDLADGESGDAAVIVVVSKKKTDAAEAKVADPAQPAAQEKPKYSFYAKLQIDEGVRLCLQEQKRAWEVRNKLRGEEAKLMEQPGNEARLKELSDELGKLWLEQDKRREKRRTLMAERDAFYEENRIPMPWKPKPTDNTSNDTDTGSNPNGVNGSVCNNNDGGSCGYSDNGGNNDEYQKQHYPHGHDERQVERGHYYNKDGESDKSAGSAAQVVHKKPFIKKGTLNGSEKRKQKNAKKNSGTEPEKVKKQDSEVDGSADKQPLEDEKKTLAEYEKMREEKRKTSEASKTEVRKVTAEEFKDCQMLVKVEKAQPKVKVEKAPPKVKEASKKEEVQTEGKDAAAKDGKPKKVVDPELLQGFFRQPRRVTYNQEDGSFARARFNGGFQGGSCDNSTEPRVNGRAAHNEAGGNGAPRGAYNGRGDGAPRGDLSGNRDGYRGNGGYGYGRGNDRYQGNGGHGGYHNQQQGGKVGRFHQERAGNGGQQRGNSGFRRNSGPAPSPVLDLEKMFPVLSAPSSARSAAPASADVPAQASAPAAAPQAA